MSTRYVVPILAIAMCSAIGQNTNSSTRTFDFPLVGLGSTETAEIDVVNVAANSNGGGAAAACSGTLSFKNAAGATIAGATTFTNLASGAVASAKLPFSSSGGTAPRTLIRPGVTLTIPSTTPRAPCNLEITFSTYDTTTGATHVLLTGAEQGTVGGPHGR